MISFLLRRTRVPVHGLLVVCLLLLTTACGPKQIAPPTTPASNLWESFSLRRDAADQSLRGLKISASLHYADRTRQNRITLSLWGSPMRPLRLDLSAGFGTTFAMVRETNSGWWGYIPEKNTIYESQDARHGQSALGLDLPFTLRELVGVAIGSYNGLVPSEFMQAEPTSDGGWIYFFAPNSQVTSMTLDGEGKPVVFAGRLSGKDWTMTLSRHGEDATAAPEKINILLGKDVTAVLRIKQLERRSTPWPDESLVLKLPPGTVITPLDL